MRVKLPKTIVSYFCELGEVETSIRKPASLIFYVFTIENDDQKQEKNSNNKTPDGDFPDMTGPNMRKGQRLLSKYLPKKKKEKKT